MNMQIMKKLQNIPELPGVYFMKNTQGDIIYIGKSNCLKKRVKSYFSDSPTWEKARKMVLFIADIEWIVTDTHMEAMLLECELIKSVRPYFNVIMKYENHYVYLKLNAKPELKPISMLSQREDNCYGPFRSRNVLIKLLEDFLHIYPILKVKSDYHFDYHIFPISMDSEVFQINYQVLLELCEKGNARNRFKRELVKRMKKAAKEERFELAAFYRDLLNSFEYLHKSLNSCYELRNQIVLLTLKANQGYKLFLISQGRIIQKEVFMNITKEGKDSFLRKGYHMISQMEKDSYDWKAAIDFWDIIYSELKGLPPDQYECIPWSKKLSLRNSDTKEQQF